MRGGGPPREGADAERFGDADDKDLARRRLKAARLCDTAMYVSFAALVAVLLLGGVLAAVVGVVGIVFGAMGLSSVSRVGKGSRREEGMGGLVWAAVRSVRRAPAKAWAGIGLGLISVALGVVSLLALTKEQRRQREAQREFREFLEEMERLDHQPRREPSGR